MIRHVRRRSGTLSAINKTCKWIPPERRIKENRTVSQNTLSIKGALRLGTGKAISEEIRMRTRVGVTYDYTDTKNASRTIWHVPLTVQQTQMKNDNCISTTDCTAWWMKGRMPGFVSHWLDCIGYLLHVAVYIWNKILTVESKMSP